MAAYGLYSHIQSNRRRSIALLIGLFFLVYLMVYAGALIAEALSVDADLNTLMQRALRDLIGAAPLATIGTALWIVIAYFFHQKMIDALTGGREITRAEQPRLYNILENLCISRGITMPKLKVMDFRRAQCFRHRDESRSNIRSPSPLACLPASTMPKSKPCLAMS